MEIFFSQEGRRRITYRYGVPVPRVGTLNVEIMDEEDGKKFPLDVGNGGRICFDVSKTQTFDFQFTPIEFWVENEKYSLISHENRTFSIEGQQIANLCFKNVGAQTLEFEVKRECRGQEIPFFDVRLPPGGEWKQLQYFSNPENRIILPWPWETIAVNFSDYPDGSHC